MHTPPFSDPEKLPDVAAHRYISRRVGLMRSVTLNPKTPEPNMMKVMRKSLDNLFGTNQ